MLSLRNLCRKLQRIGIFACVSKNPHEPYVVRWKYPGQLWSEANTALFPTVKGCCDFLLTFWR